MSPKLNRDAILRELLRTLINGWGQKAVYDALNEFTGDSSANSSGNRKLERTARTDSNAMQLVEGLQITGERKHLFLQLAKAFDEGTAFPRIADVRAFLASHHLRVKELRTRDEAFRKMLPLLMKMSEKGLLKVISRSQHSGPAELGSISDAIKGAGHQMRGSFTNDDSDQS